MVWADSDEKKKKGSGVGIAINKKWERHLARVEVIESFVVKASFIFKKAELVFWSLYIPPNNEQQQKRIQRQIMKSVIAAKQNTHHIIGGDFNIAEDPKLDNANFKKDNNNKAKKRLPLLSWLKSLGFVETFRACNPEAKKFSWSNSRSATRIDHIWVSESLSRTLRQSDIEEMDMVTQSDHNLVWAEVGLEEILGPQKAETGDSQKATRKVYLYEKATKENWEDYRTQLDHAVKSNYRKLLERSKGKERIEREIDELWEVIEKAIGKAAANNVLVVKIKRDRAEVGITRRPYQKELKMLARLQKKTKDREGQEVDEINKMLYNEQINIINREAGAEVPKLIDKVSSI